MNKFYQKHRDALLLTGILIVALLCRILRYYECDLLERDTFAYLKMAKAWSENGILYAYSSKSDGYLSSPPLLPGIMAWGQTCGIGALNAGLWFNVLAGALIPLALYIICRAVFEDRRYALWAAVLGAIHPFTLRLSALVMRDVPYISAVIFAVACGVWAAKTRKLRYWLFFSFFAVAATMLRKEGFELMLVFACWCLWSLWQARAVWKTELFYWLKSGLCVLVLFCLSLFPLQFYLKKNSECTWGVIDQEWISSMYRKVVKADFAGEYEEKQKH